jgi:hypothetical protein
MYFMKKQSLVILLVIYLFCADSMLAQVSRPRRIEAGIFAGPTIDWAVANTHGYKTTGVKGGGVYGINIDLNLHQTSSNYYFSTGINARHIRYGLEYKDTNYSYFDDETNTWETINPTRINSTFNTVYLSIPTAIKLKTDIFFDRLVFWGLVGLEHGIALVSKSNDEITREDGTKGKYAKIDQYKNTAIFKESLYIVLGAEFIIKNNTKATFGIGYDYGFNNIFRKKYENSISGSTVNARAHRIEFQFGIIF